MKKGQISVYIIIGIIVLAWMGIAVLSNKDRTESLRSGFSDTTLSFEKESLNNYLEDCLQGSFESALQNSDHAALESAVESNVRSCINDVLVLYQGKGIQFENQNSFDLELEDVDNGKSYIARLNYPLLMKQGDSSSEFGLFIHRIRRTINSPIDTDANGKVLEDTKIFSEDSHAILNIPKGIIALNSDGTPVKEISMHIGDSPFDPNSISFVAYDLLPNGATFSGDGIELILDYSDAVEGKDWDEDQIRVSWYDENNNKYVEFETELDTDLMQVKAKIPHFTSFGLMKADGCWNLVNTTKLDPKFAGYQYIGGLDPDKTYKIELSGKIGYYCDSSHASDLDLYDLTHNMKDASGNWFWDFYVDDDVWRPETMNLSGIYTYNKTFEKKEMIGFRFSDTIYDDNCGEFDVMLYEQEYCIFGKDEIKDPYADITWSGLDSGVVADHDGYIIELNNPSLIDRESYKNVKNIQGLKEKEDLLKKLKNEIKNEQILLEQEISSLLGREPEMLGKNSLLKNILVMDIDDNEAMLIEKSANVNAVVPNYIVKAIMYDSPGIVDADYVWHDYGYSGEGMKIAILDTGIDYTHPDLGGCYADGCKVVGGYDIVNNDDDPMDDQGHGTHCAGIAAGNGALKGIAYEADLYAYKVLNEDGTGSWSQIIDGLEMAMDPDGDGDISDSVDVASLSIGSEIDISWFNIMIDNIVDDGLVIVSAAGNNGPELNTIFSPGSAKNAITVGASNKYGDIASFSSRGPSSAKNKPDLVAPGVSICSSRYDMIFPDNLCLDEKHIAIGGTSMATPMVAGAVALIKQADPDLSGEEIKYLLKMGAVNLGYDLNAQGFGRLNIEKSLWLLDAHDLTCETGEWSSDYCAYCIDGQWNGLCTAQHPIIDQGSISEEDLCRCQIACGEETECTIPGDTGIGDCIYEGSYDLREFGSSLYDQARYVAVSENSGDPSQSKAIVTFPFIKLIQGFTFGLDSLTEPFYQSQEGMFIPRGIDTDSDGNIYVADVGAPAVGITVLDDQGNYLRRFGMNGSGIGEFVTPFDVWVDDDDHIYVADTGNYRVQKFDTDFNFIMEFGSYGYGDGQFMKVDSVAVDSKGYIYVADAVRRIVSKFDEDGSFIAYIGRTGMGNGEYMEPADLAIDEKDRLYISDIRGNKIVVFTDGGQFITKFGRIGTSGSDLYYPYGLDVYDGHIFLVDHNNFELKRFTCDFSNIGDEVCTDDFDNDLDGYIDLDDPDCMSECEREYSYFSDVLSWQDTVVQDMHCCGDDLFEYPRDGYCHLYDIEICDNGIDDNLDGYVDLDDPFCEEECNQIYHYYSDISSWIDLGFQEPYCCGDDLYEFSDGQTCQLYAPEICDNGIDDDLDGYFDLDDPDCVQECVAEGHYFDSTSNSYGPIVYNTDFEHDHVKDMLWDWQCDGQEYCCGDDGEHYNSKKIFLSSITDGCDDKFDNACLPIEDDPYDDACCNASFTDSCVQSSYCTEEDDYGYNSDTTMHCDSGVWHDPDESRQQCIGNARECINRYTRDRGEKYDADQCWVLSGEYGVGEYNDRSTYECCGDDSGEYITCNDESCICCPYENALNLGYQCVAYVCEEQEEIALFSGLGLGIDTALSLDDKLGVSLFSESPYGLALNYAVQSDTGWQIYEIDYGNLLENYSSISYIRGGVVLISYIEDRGNRYDLKLARMGNDEDVVIETIARVDKITGFSSGNISLSLHISNSQGPIVLFGYGWSIDKYYLQGSTWSKENICTDCFSHQATIIDDYLHILYYKENPDVSFFHKGDIYYYDGYYNGITQCLGPGNGASISYDALGDIHIVFGRNTSQYYYNEQFHHMTYDRSDLFWDTETIPYLYGGVTVGNLPERTIKSEFMIDLQGVIHASHYTTYGNSWLNYFTWYDDQHIDILGTQNLRKAISFSKMEFGSGPSNHIVYGSDSEGILHHMYCGTKRSLDCKDLCEGYDAYTCAYDDQHTRSLCDDSNTCYYDLVYHLGSTCDKPYCMCYNIDEGCGTDYSDCQGRCTNGGCSEEEDVALPEIGTWSSDGCRYYLGDGAWSAECTDFGNAKMSDWNGGFWTGEKYCDCCTMCQAEQIGNCAHGSCDCSACLGEYGIFTTDNDYPIFYYGNNTFEKGASVETVDGGGYSYYSESCKSDGSNVLNEFTYKVYSIGWHGSFIDEIPCDTIDEGLVCSDGRCIDPDEPLSDLQMLYLLHLKK